MKKYDGKLIDIKATAEKRGEKCVDLLAINALSGCDVVSYPFEPAFEIRSNTPSIHRPPGARRRMCEGRPLLLIMIEWSHHLLRISDIQYS